MGGHDGGTSGRAVTFYHLSRVERLPPIGRFPIVFIGKCWQAAMYSQTPTLLDANTAGAQARIAGPSRDPTDMQDHEELPTWHHASLESHAWGNDNEPPQRTWASKEAYAHLSPME